MSLSSETRELITTITSNQVQFVESAISFQSASTSSAGLVEIASVIESIPNIDQLSFEAITSTSGAPVIPTLQQLHESELRSKNFYISSKHSETLVLVSLISQTFIHPLKSTDLIISVYDLNTKVTVYDATVETLTDSTIRVTSNTNRTLRINLRS